MSTRVSLVDLAEATGIAASVLAAEVIAIQRTSLLEVGRQPGGLAAAQRSWRAWKAGTLTAEPIDAPARATSAGANDAAATRHAA